MKVFVCGWPLRINHMKIIYSQKRYCHVETRFDDLEITTDKTLVIKRFFRNKVRNFE